VTRLNESHLRETRRRIAGLDDALRMRAGMDLRGVALCTIGVAEAEASRLPPTRVAVVPITMGAGAIPGFGEVVCAIARHVGLEAGVTRRADVAGLAEAYAGGADIVVLADDLKFIAIHRRSGAVVDNDRATGEGFAVLLDRMAAGVGGRACGLIGCGPVGCFAARRLVQLGAEVTVCDRDEARRRGLVDRLRAEGHPEITAVGRVADLLAHCRLLLDATPADGIISAEDIRPDTVISAPGVPMGLTPEALALAGPRFYHDNLPLGVAVMVLAAAHGRLSALSTGC
jgi:pyrrolysine biosynthesis protein PylD